MSRPSSVPEEKITRRSPSPAFMVLMDLITYSGTASPELDLMLAAIDAGLPGFIERTLKVRDEKLAQHWESLRLQEAEKTQQEAAREAAKEAKRQAKVALWVEWLETSGQALVDAWKPTDEKPELSDGVWWAIGPDNNVIGVGLTPAEAHQDANAWLFEALEDPVDAARSFDPPSDKQFWNLVYGEGGQSVRFLYVEGSEPNLAPRVGVRLSVGGR